MADFKFSDFAKTTLSVATNKADGITISVQKLEESSKLKIIVSDDYESGKYYRLTGDVSLAFKRKVLGSAHAFRLPFHGGVFCDRIFKNAVGPQVFHSYRLQWTLVRRRRRLLR
jgi:hypothetical protein